MTQGPVRVRFAPSPTGLAHIGSFRTTLFNWLFARHNNGSFILRIEDTDQQRLVPGALEDLLESLRWLGLDWDEGPEAGGEYQPYFQSQRLELYKKYAWQLVESGAAYPCFCGADRLAQMREEQRKQKLNPGYDRLCRDIDPVIAKARVEAGEPFVIRLKVPLSGQTVYQDFLHGEIVTENSTLDDLVLLKTDGFPTYHLANVIDDHFMRITHVLRGDEWMPSTPRHVLLYQAFGWEMPVFAHVPLVLSPDGKGKLSKRHGAVSVSEFRKKGYLPEAMVNYLALVGWAYDDKTELMTRDELIERFSLEGLSKSPAAFSYDKLDWMNGYYIRALSAEDLAKRLAPYMEASDLPSAPETLMKIVPLIRERIKVLSDVAPMVDFIFCDNLEYAPEALLGKNMDAASSYQALLKARDTLSAITWTEQSMEETMYKLAESLGLKPGQLFGIIRIAVSGRTVAPPLFGTLIAMGQEKSLARIDIALTKLGLM